MSGQTAPDNDILLRRFILPAIVLCLLSKLYLASILDLYSDEVFYWLASTKPAIAYSDLPFITSLLAGLGASLNTNDTLALRSLFILLGSLIPLLVYWVALPLSTKQKATESALFSLCLPLGGFLGLLAVPDVPLVVFGLLAFGCFERAIRTDGITYWLLTGLLVAAGFSTHYRFILYPASAILFLTLCPSQRKQWLNRKLWLAFAIASLGLGPIIWFNLNHDLSSASFYFVDRHPWEFQPSGLLHIVKQAGLVTPPLYALLVYTLLVLYRKTRAGEVNASLVFYFSITHLTVYMVLAPWSDATSTSIHWPLSGYFPLLIMAPYTLRQLATYAEEKWHALAKPFVLKGIPIIGFLGTLTAFVGIGSQAFQEPLQAVFGRNVLSNKMAGWEEFNMALKKHLENFDSPPTVITDNYYTAAQIEFAGTSDGTFTIDENKAIRDGRITQLHLWQKDSAGLVASNASNFLFITEDSTLNVEEKERVLSRICSWSRNIQWDSSISLFSGDKRFGLYSGILLGQDTTEKSASPCPYPSRAWIDYPPAEASLSGKVTVAGWAFNQDMGVEQINLTVDGKKAGTASYGMLRQDVADIYADKTASDPNSPSLGFSLLLDTESFSRGQHEIELEIVSGSGETSYFGKRKVEFSL